MIISVFDEQEPTVFQREGYALIALNDSHVVSINDRTADAAIRLGEMLIAEGRRIRQESLWQLSESL